MGIDDYEQVEMRSRSELRAWLKRNHGRTEPVWLATWKKGTAHYLAYDDIVEEAICWGWIDSTTRSLDAERSMRLFGPRRPRSIWSALNRKRVEKLDAAGLIRPPGRAKIDAAKKDGSWSALDAVDRLEVPTDLAAALRSDRNARATFDAWPPSLRKSALYWIGSARRDATRAKRIAEIVADARRGRRPARWS